MVAHRLAGNIYKGEWKMSAGNAGGFVNIGLKRTLLYVTDAIAAHSNGEDVEISVIVNGCRSRMSCGGAEYHRSDH